MLKDFFTYLFNEKVSNEDKSTRLSMFFHFLGFYHHKEGGKDVFGEGKASVLDFLYRKRFGFKQDPFCCYQYIKILRHDS